MLAKKFFFEVCDLLKYNFFDCLCLIALCNVILGYAVFVIIEFNVRYFLSLDLQ